MSSLDRGSVFLQSKQRENAPERIGKMERQREFEIVQHTRMNLLEIFLVEMTSRGPHGHDDLEIGLILEGSLTLFIDQERHDLRTGDLYVINRNQVHSFLNTRGQSDSGLSDPPGSLPPHRSPPGLPVSGEQYHPQRRPLPASAGDPAGVRESLLLPLGFSGTKMLFPALRRSVPDSDHRPLQFRLRESLRRRPE